MALPTKTTLITMDTTYQGSPFVNVPSKSAIDTSTMECVYQGEPFVTNPEGGEAPPAAAYIPKIIFY